MGRDLSFSFILALELVLKLQVPWSWKFLKIISGLALLFLIKICQVYKFVERSFKIHMLIHR